MVKPSRSKLREIVWAKLDYLTRDASHQSNQIKISKGMAQHEHYLRQVKSESTGADWPEHSVASEL